MIHTTECCKNEDRSRRALASLALMLLLSGCAAPVARFHAYEGGAIAQNPPPPPGLHQPFPNLAAVPPRPSAISARMQRQLRAALEAENIKQNQISGPVGPESLPAKIVPIAAPTQPVLLGFPPGSAILTSRQTQTLDTFATKRGPALIRVAGFATARTGAGLRLALLRATAIANALTLAGVPSAQIRIDALTGAHGGAVQFLFPASTTRPKDRS